VALSSAALFYASVSCIIGVSSAASWHPYPLRGILAARQATIIKHGGGGGGIFAEQRRGVILRGNGIHQPGASFCPSF